VGGCIKGLQAFHQKKLQGSQVTAQLGGPKKARENEKRTAQRNMDRGSGGHMLVKSLGRGGAPKSGEQILGREIARQGLKSCAVVLLRGAGGV